MRVHVSVLQRNKALGIEAGWWGFPDVWTNEEDPAELCDSRDWKNVQCKL